MTNEHRKNTIIIQVVTPFFDSHIKCITPQFANFLKYMDGERDPNISKYIFPEKKPEKKDLMHYFHDRYGSDAILKALLFYKNFPDEIARNRIKKTFPNVKFILFTNDIHIHAAKLKSDLNNVDGIIGLTTHAVFEAFFRLDISNKLLHAGNRCPDEFLRDVPNFETDQDAIFYYGTQYPNRKSFLNVARENWNVVIHPPPGRRGYYGWDCTYLSTATAKELFKYRYSFTTGYCCRGRSNPYYLVAKFFEIMGSGCLLLCDTTGVKSQLEELGFYDGQHYLSVNAKTSAKVRKYVEGNPDIVRAIRSRAHRLVKEKYTIKLACEPINAKLANL
jgi:hypothetical protein